MKSEPETVGYPYRNQCDRATEKLAQLIEAPQARRQPLRIEVGRRDPQRRPYSVLVVEVAELEFRVGKTVVGVEIGARDRPAAVRHPVPLLKVNRVERGVADASFGWRVADAPEAYTQRLLNGIVGVEITITKIEATWKTSQNKSAQDQQSVMSALDSVGSDQAKEMAVAIKVNALSE